VLATADDFHERCDRTLCYANPNSFLLLRKCRSLADPVTLAHWKLSGDQCKISDCGSVSGRPRPENRARRPQ